MHRALLLFVTRYHSEIWPDLEFLTTEFEGVWRSLEDQGYDIDQRSSRGELSAAEINEKLERFIHESRRGDHLLIYLSGHGYYYDRAHWFAASESKLDAGAHSMLVTNVRLDGAWPDLVEASQAEQVLVMIDACRDRLESSSASNRPAISPPEGSDRLSYLMACAPEASAAFIASQPTQEVTFSLFTQAFQEILADFEGNLTVDHLRKLMETSIREILTSHHATIKEQIPRLSGEEGAKRFPVLREQYSVDTRNMSRNSEIWNLVVPGHEKQRLQLEVACVAAQLDDEFREERGLLSADSWLDWHAHGRASKNLEMLLGFLPSDFRFTAIEAAVLSLAPHLYHGFHVRLAHRVDEARERSFSVLDGSHEAWAQYPRLQRQTETKLDSNRGRLNRHTADAWVLHQFLARPADAHKHEDELLRYLDSALAGTDELAESLNVDTVAWLFRAMFYGGSTLAEAPDLQSPKAIRFQLVGYLLAVSQMMALAIVELPPVLVEHLGDRDRIGFFQIRDTVRNAQWVPIGRTLRLEAHCPNQALMVALQERAESLDGLLYTANSIQGLERLPNRASGDGVGPEEDLATGQLKFLPVATRFGLDGTRVRDLLAGEQLYADKSLAIRELYQNALDACNVRKARETFRPGRTSDRWEGRIAISQGWKGNAHYVECVDNGSGMGRGELLHAFAQGGVRLSHLTEFQEEKLQWRKKGIAFHENSRFGIGVLSYFMLADEIEVITRKFHRDRSAGRTLKVAITGPDNLFHVEESQEEQDFLGDTCGTRVRWYLRSDLDDFSCVAALRSVLGITKYETTAECGEDREVWQPLTYVSRPGSPDVSRIDASGSIESDSGHEVFWCEYGGSLLIDGISVSGSWDIPEREAGATERFDEMLIPGAVVNLSGAVVVSPGQGKRVPRLTVDRNRVIDDVFAPIAKRLRAAARSLASAEFLSSEWLERAARTEPRLADVIVEGLVEAEARLPFHDGTAAMGITGYFPGDEVIRHDWQSLSPPRSDTYRNVSGHLPAHLALWRYAAHFPDQVQSVLGDLCPSDWEVRSLRPALPSDAVVLGGVINTQMAQTWDRVGSIGRALQSAKELHMDLRKVAEKMEELGHPVAQIEKIITLPLSVLYSLLGVQVGDRYQPHKKTSPISPVSLLKACDKIRMTLPEATNLLSQLGYDVSLCAVFGDLNSQSSAQAKKLLSARFDGRSPWFTGDVTSHRIVAASEKLDLTIDEVCDFYKRSGLRSHSHTVVGEDRTLIESLSYGCRYRKKARPGDILRAARGVGADVQVIVKRLKALGFEVEGELPERMPECVDLLLSPVDKGEPLDPGKAVPLPVIAELARRTGESSENVATQLHSMGIDVTFSKFPKLEAQDLILLTRGLESSEYQSKPWLNPARPVPFAHMLLAASQFRQPLSEIRDRLIVLGMRVEESSSDAPIRSGFFNASISLKEWIPYDETTVVPLGIILRTAMQQRDTVPLAAQRLQDHGFLIPPLPDGLEQVHPQDIALLGNGMEYGRLEISFSRPIYTGAVVQAAARAGISIPDARARLIELGASISRPGYNNDYYKDRDLFKLLSSDMGDVPAAAVLIVAEVCASGPAEVAARLQAAGYKVQEFEYDVELPRPEDLLLLKRKSSKGGNYISVAKPIDFEHLLISAHRLQCSVSDAAQRLQALGVPVPDVRKTITRAWAMVPRRERF